MGSFIVISIIWAFFAVLVMPFTLLVRELGHAIPLMLLTRKGATIFIGSYGYRYACFKLSLGPLKIYIRYNLKYWRGSRCIPDASDVSYAKRLSYMLWSPIFTLLVAIVIFWSAIHFNLHGAIKLISLLGICAALTDQYNALKSSIVKQADGFLRMSDGAVLRLLFKGKTFYNKYELAGDTYAESKFPEAAALFMELIREGHGSQFLYRWAADAYYQAEDYNAANEVMQEMITKYVAEPEDYLMLADIAHALNQPEEEARHFEALVGFDDADLMNEIGHRLNYQERFEEAIPYFNTAIGLDLESADAYSCRGHAKIGIGELEEGLTDIKYSLTLRADNPLAYKNLGIYHLAKGEKEQALALLMKAKDMGVLPHLIDDYIHQAS